MNNNISDIKISIGLGVYNEEKLVSRMIKSILAQSHKNFELIISDDCSLDHTLKICKDFETYDSRIDLFHQKENIGVVKNLDFLLKKSQCDFFIYLAGDDYISENYLEENLKNLIENPDCACSAGPHVWEDQDFNNDKISFQLKGTLFERLSLFLTNSFNATAMNYAIYRKKTMEKCPQLQKKFLGHDWKIMCNGLSEGTFLRSNKTLIILGRGGISSAPEFMKSEENNIVERFLPLLEFTKYFVKTFILKPDLKFFQKIILVLKITKLNLHLSIMKIINTFRFSKSKPHIKIGPAYKK
jgi:glycosyltransferase involved in cell wall biosynthesis